MQSIFGALLAAGYAAAATAAIQTSGYTQEINATIETQLVKSFAGAEQIAAQYPQYASGITAGAKASFLAGDGRGNFALAPAIIVPTNGYGPVAVGDFNGDGVPDLDDSGFIRFGSCPPVQPRRRPSH